MTSNEKRVLVKFKELKQANTVTMAGTLRVTINYAYDVCNKLCEKGYLERLSPGRFALYRITPLGEEQIKTDVPTEEAPPPAPSPSATPGINFVEGSDSVGRKVKVEKYECSNCVAAVKEDDTECPKCGIIFGEAAKEGEATEQRAEALPSAPSVVEESDSEEEKTGILDHPSAPEEWTTCNWKWKAGGKNG